MQFKVYSFIISHIGLSGSAWAVAPRGTSEFGFLDPLGWNPGCIVAEAS